MQSPSQIFKQCDYIVSINRILVLKKYTQRSRCRGKKKKKKSCFRGWKMQLQFLSPPRSSRYKTSCCQPPCADFRSAPHTLGTWSLNMPPVVCIDRIRQKIPCAFASSQSAWGPPSHPPGSRQKYSHTMSLILPRVWVALNQD